MCKLKCLNSFINKCFYNNIYNLRGLYLVKCLLKREGNNMIFYSELKLIYLQDK